MANSNKSCISDLNSNTMKENRNSSDFPLGIDAKEKLQEPECIESVVAQNGEGAYVSPQEVQARFPLLRDLSTEQMGELNKRVLRKIDWRLLPIVSLMYLMK